MDYKTRMMYRRRRTYTVLVLLALIGVIWWGISAMRADTGAKPVASASPEVLKSCSSKAVEVKALVGDGTQVQTQFAKDVNPMIWFSLTNLTKHACTFEAGSIGQFYTITTGPDTVWDSAKCDRTADASAVVTLQPGKTLSSPPSAWMKVSSSDTGCGEGQKPVITGGASYHLSVTVNGFKSSNDMQFVLN